MSRPIAGVINTGADWFMLSTIDIDILHDIYLDCKGGAKMPVFETVQTTKVFMNGRSQAVRIPAEFRFEEDELFVNKIGDTLMLTPKSSLIHTLKQGASMVSEDFMADGRPDEISASREEL